MAKMLAVLMVALFLHGCATTHGSPITQDKMEMLITGETTIDQAVQIFGKPVVNSVNSDGTTIMSWGYAKSTLTEPLETQGLSVVFDANGKVSSFSRSDYGNLQ